MKIFLLGFMGSGKSTIGQAFARSVHFDFVDLDTRIEKKEGKSIARIFEEAGEEAFRILESNELRQCSELQKTIIATGGGTPCFNDNMTWMNENGLTIYIQVPAEVLVQRLQNESGNRPLIKGMNVEQLSSFVGKKVAEREVFYKQAHFICHAADPVEVLLKSLTGYFSRFTDVVPE